MSLLALLAFVPLALLYTGSVFWLPYRASWALKGAPIAVLLGGALWAGAWGLAAGLALSLAGDVLRGIDRVRFFKEGLGAFLLAHVVYTGMFFQTAGWEGPGVWAASGLMGAVAALLAWLWPRLGRRRGLVVAYASLLVSMAASAILQQPFRPLLAGAVALFVASDAMLGVETFSAPFPGVRFWVISTYYLAQAGIYGFFLVP